ncbi:hypothetical protein KCU62_g7018, partial [Aureobasidium sp. EXF-3399]
MGDSTQHDPDGEEASNPDSKTRTSESLNRTPSFLGQTLTASKTTLHHDTTNFVLTQEAIINTNSSGPSFTRTEQREDPNTIESGPINRGIKRPFSAISDASSSSYKHTMANDKSPTSTDQTNEAMENSEQRTAGSSTSPGPASQVPTTTNDNITEPATASGPKTSVMTRKAATANIGSNEVMNNDTQRTASSSASPNPASHLSTMSSTTNDNSTSPSNNTSRKICRFTRPSARLVNAPLSSTSRAGNSFSAISSIESTPEAASMSESNTPPSGAMATPNSNSVMTPGSTAQANIASHGSITTQGSITQNIINPTSTTMSSNNTTEPPTYAQVTAAGSLSSITATATASVQPTPPLFSFPSTSSATSPQPQPRYHTPLSLASTSTNRPLSATFNPLRPIHNWVSPRPAIFARTEWSDAQKAESIADEETSKAEKTQEAERKAREMEMLTKGAKKAEAVEKERRAKEL